MPELTKSKTCFLFHQVIGLLGVISFIAYTWRGLDYAISIITLFLLYVLAHKFYNRNLYISLISCMYMFAMLCLTILACKFDAYATILQQNKVAASYIADGTLLRVSTIGYLMFILGQYLVFRAHHAYGVRNVNSLASSAQSPDISISKNNIRIWTKYGMIVPVGIWMFIMIFGKSIIWLYPHMSRGVDIPYSTLLMVFVNFMTPVIINLALISNIETKTVIFYSIFLSLLALSSGSRASCIVPLMSIVLIFKFQNIFSASFRLISFILLPLGGTIISFFGKLRFEIAENKIVDIVSSFAEEIKMGGIIEYIFCGFPVLGQNVAHYSVYLHLYDMGQRSTIMPYINGILNIVPRNLGLMMGLPVDPYDVHAWQLHEFGVTTSGGSYLFGEPYWLGGLPAIIVVSFLFGSIMMLLDLRFAKRKFIGHYIGGCILLSMGIGYGFSGWMRAFYLLLFLDIAVSYIEKKHFLHRIRPTELALDR